MSLNPPSGLVISTGFDRAVMLFDNTLLFHGINDFVQVCL